MLENAVQSILMLYLLLLTGFWISSKDWFKGGDTLLSKLLIQIILPCNVFRSVVTYLTDLDEFLTLAGLAVWVAVVLVLSVTASWLLSALLKLPRLRRGVFIGASSFPNIILLGFPIVEAVLGEASMKYAVVYFLADTLLFWSLCTYILLHFGERGVERPRPLDRLKKLSSPSLAAMLAALLMTALGLRLPAAADQAVARVSQCSNALSMFFIGAIIRQSRLGDGLLSRDSALILLWKLAGVPALVLLVLGAVPMPAAARQVFFLLTVMPVCVNFSILSHQYRCDYKFATVISAAMNVLCIAMLPLYILVMQLAWPG